MVVGFDIPENLLHEHHVRSANRARKGGTNWRNKSLEIPFNSSHNSSTMSSDFEHVLVAPSKTDGRLCASNSILTPTTWARVATSELEIGALGCLLRDM